MVTALYYEPVIDISEANITAIKKTSLVTCLLRKRLFYFFMRNYESLVLWGVCVCRKKGHRRNW